MPVHNRWELTESCLQHLRVQTLLHTVVVCDNSSSDGTAGRVRMEFPDARILELGANLGFAAACNRGVGAGDGEVVILLNNDVECPEDFLERLVAPIRDDYRVGLPKARGEAYGKVEGFINEYLYAYDVKLGDTKEVKDK